MRRGTTPTILIDVDGEDFEGATVYVTIEQGSDELTIKDPDIEKTELGSRVYIRLSQEQTLSLHTGTAYVQIRWITETGVARASNICSVSVEKILRDGVIYFEDKGD